MRALLVAALGVQVLAGQDIRLTQVVSGLTAPADIQNAGDGSGRLFLVQQNGLIRMFRNGALAAQPFLDIRTKTRLDGERGLLGLAFPPGFDRKQRFYVDYTDLNGNTVIAQYRVTGNPDLADAASETVLLNITQPFANHNGGQLRFGPDGYLYIGMGDGGSAGDPMRNGQNLGSLLGKILRIDVDTEPGRVRIPADNPFVNRTGARPEIWAIGMRNPWRFTFDRANGDLWIADVGQDAYEEVDYQPAGSPGGENYGWNLMEGMHCYQSGCSQQGLTLPIAEYSHAEGCSITGGFVYRGRLSPGMRGLYFYGDYCSGRIWGLERQGAQWVNRLLLSSGFGITTFGEDESGELYVANANNGTVHRISGSAAPRVLPGGLVNAASFVEGLAPGSAASAFTAGVLDDPGIIAADRIPLPTSLNGVSVTVNGIAAPIYAIANVKGQEQINFQTPFETAGQTRATVAVTRAGQSSPPVDVAVVDPQPAVYASGGQAILVHNADDTLVTAARPLVRGEFAFLYAAGLGRTSNQPLTGAGASALPPAATQGMVSVTIAGISCDVQFAGLAPGLVGVYQVNFQVPPNAPAGAPDLVLAIAGASSPAVKAMVQ